MFRPAPLALIGFALTAGCESGNYLAGAVPPPPPPPLVTVTVGPDDATIVSGGTLQYQAISTSSVAGWEWSVSNPVNGTVASNGVFHALEPGDFQVRACASNAPTICSTARASVMAVPASGGAPTVTLIPAADTISVGQTLAFAVSASNFVTPGWTWIAVDNTTATIDGSGVLTARRGGVSVVVACASSEPHFCGSAEVRVR